MTSCACDGACWLSVRTRAHARVYGLSVPFARIVCVCVCVLLYIYYIILYHIISDHIIHKHTPLARIGVHTWGAAIALANLVLRAPALTLDKFVVELGMSFFSHAYLLYTHTYKHIHTHTQMYVCVCV